MSYRHIKLEKITSDNPDTILYEITSPDFNDKFIWESFGIIEINKLKKEFTHHSSDNWNKNKIYPLDLFMLPKDIRDKAIQEKYSDYAGASWSKAIVDYIDDCFSSREWKDDINLNA